MVDLLGANEEGIIMETVHVRAKGIIVLPMRIRKKYGIEEGSLLILDETKDGFVLRPAMAIPVQKYTAEQRAEFILNSAIDADDYQRARKVVEQMGLDPDAIDHDEPV